MVLLPNLLTLCSIFCGFYAVVLCAAPSHPSPLDLAAWVVFAGMVLDLLDGRLARLTRTASEFGRHLDSLADLLSFGMAPAVLLYTWALHDLGLPGLFIAFAYVACGAIRLARFNVLANEPAGEPRGGEPTIASPKPDRSIGLPTPPAAGAVVAMVTSTHPFLPVGGWAWAVAAGAVSLAALMVGTVRFRTFKDLRPTRRTWGTIGVLGAGVATIAIMVSPGMALAAIFTSYIGTGLVASRTPAPPPRET